MNSGTCKRIVAAFLVVTALTLVVPARAQAATLSIGTAYPGLGLWAKAMEFLHSVFQGAWGPVAGHQSKFGAAHTSDGVVRLTVSTVQAF
jgi:hypothetical protein